MDSIRMVSSSTALNFTDSRRPVEEATRCDTGKSNEFEVDASQSLDVDAWGQVSCCAGDHPMTSLIHRAFEDATALDAWLNAHHRSETELWVRIFKKGSGTPSVTWADCVVACITWGWIDGHKRSLDDVSFLQRLTPRRAKSSWSKKNREHAERLIASGLMQPTGLVHVEVARLDGRWERAYAGSADMVIPDDFLEAVAMDAAAKAFYDGLDRQNLFAIYHRIHTASRPETRRKRIAAIVAQLSTGTRFH